jgi:hypothetical protein
VVAEYLRRDPDADPDAVSEVVTALIAGLRKPVADPGKLVGRCQRQIRAGVKKITDARAPVPGPETQRAEPIAQPEPAVPAPEMMAELFGPHMLELAGGPPAAPMAGLLSPEEAARYVLAGTNFGGAVSAEEEVPGGG